MACWIQRSITLGQWPRTAHGRKEELGSARVTHPYHPLRGQTFPVLKVRRVGGVEFLSLQETSGSTLYIPLAWTDRAETSCWQILGKNPPCFSVPALWTLVELFDSLSESQHEEGES